jgi:uncharacterized protein (DUF58 family)
VKQDYQQLLKPEIINTLSGLTLISKVTVQGFLAGLNHSKRLGAGMEFSQYRGYQPGDDMRLLDWKMLARSGRYYIKQSEIETHVRIKFIVDASHSMQHEEGGLSKMDYTRVLVASLAWLAQSQGDAIGLYALNDKQLHALQPKVDQKHFKRLLHQLIDIQPDGKWPQQTLTSQTLQGQHHKELIFFISDLYEETSELTQSISKLKTPRNEVVVLQLLGKDELEFNYKGDVTFEDLETGKQIEINTKQAQSYYKTNLQASLSRIKNNLLAEGVSYQLFQLGEPLAEALELLLKTRKNLL